MMDQEALCQRMEECALNAWPPLQQMWYDGWVLRFANGYTKRANSVNAVYAGWMDLDQKIEFCEATYRARGLRPIFRLTSFGAPPGLDEALAGRGYERIDPTKVLWRDLDDYDAQGADGEIVAADLDQWMTAFCQLTGRGQEGQETHRRMLEAIPGRTLRALYRHDGRLVSCGLGTLEAGSFGLFDIATAPEYRRQGHATRLIRSMLAWARTWEGERAYLQVMEANAMAQGLYANLGFCPLYHYWYRAAVVSNPNSA